MISERTQRPATVTGTLLRRLRPLLACLVIVSSRLCNPQACASSGTRPAVAVASQADGTTVIQADGYRAVIGADGNLHSLTVSGTEMLDDRVAFSRGAFLYADGPRELGRISQPRPGLLEATDGLFALRYDFQPKGVRITLRNQSASPVSLFVVLSPQVTIVSNLETGNAAAAPANEQWGTVRFSTESGAYLELVGGNCIWGPWLGRQVWEVSPLAPGQNREIHLQAGIGGRPKATLEQLVGMGARIASDSGLVAAGQPLDLQVSITNRAERTLHGLLSLDLSGCRSELVIHSSSPVQLPAKQLTNASFQWQVEAPDFYTARARLSVENREVARAAAVAGYRADEIAPAAKRPTDFSPFWDRFLRDAGEEPPSFRMRLQEARSRSGVDVWVAQYEGFAGKTIYAWYLVPWIPERHPALLYLSGYGARPIEPPIPLARQGYVVLAIDVRGNRVDRVRPRPFEDYCTEGILSPDTYVYREIVGHALRGIHFLHAREEVDPTRIAVVGVSEGGGVGLLLAGLTPKARAVLAAAPMLCDFPLSLRSASWPYAEIARYREAQPDHGAQIDTTLSYFDAVNFAPDVKCPVLLTIGFLDRVSLPAAVYGLFRLLPGPKEMRTLPDAGHEGGGEELWTSGLQWLAKTLALSPTS